MNDRVTVEIVAAVLTDVPTHCLTGRSCRLCSARVAAANRLTELSRISELLAAALFIRGVTAEQCDALDEWMRLT